MPDPMNDLQPPMDAASPVVGRQTNLNLTKSGNAGTPRFATPPAPTPQADTTHGTSGAGFGAFSSPDPTPLAVPDWLQDQQDAAGGVSTQSSTEMQLPMDMPLPNETPAQTAIRQVKEAMIAPLQAQIDAIEAHADVVIPLMADIKGLKGVIAATEDKNVMLEAIDELMSKLQRRMSA